MSNTRSNHPFWVLEWYDSVDIHRTIGRRLLASLQSLQNRILGTLVLNLS